MSDEQNIIAQLTSVEPEVIREGAYLAGKFRLEDAIPLLTGHIHSADIGVQEAAERALRKIGGVKVVQAVIPLLRSEDAPVRNISMDMLRQIGSTDMESLYQLLHDHDPDIRIFAADILGSTASSLAVAPLCAALLRDPEVNVRYQAAVSLGNLAFPGAASSLNKALQDDEWVRFAVVEALTKIRAESSVEALLKAMDKSSELVSSVIVDALGEMGNIKAVPQLLRRMGATSGPLRNKIVAAVIKILGLSSISLLGAKEIDNLYEYMLIAITDEDTEVQDTVVQGLVAVKNKGASRAILNLARKLNPDTDHERLLKAVEAMASIGYNEAIEDAVRSADEYSVMIGVEVISRAPSRDGVELLQELFWNFSRDLQRAVIVELATQCAPDDQHFFLDVLERHTDGTVLKAVLLFLGNKGQGPEVAEKAAAFLDHSYDDVKQAALNACVALHDPVIVGHFLALATDADPEKRLMAIQGLAAIDLTAYEKIVFDALNDPEPEVRRGTLEAIGSHCPLPTDRLARVEAMAQDPNSEVRLTVISVLGSCDDVRLDACLLKGLDDSDAWVKARCIETLGRRGVVEAVPSLVPMLYDENQLIVIRTVEALGGIGGEIAFQALLSLLDHDDSEIQQAVEEAVEKIRSSGGK